MHQRAQRDSRRARIECACGYSYRVRGTLDTAMPSQRRRLESNGRHGTKRSARRTVVRSIEQQRYMAVAKTDHSRAERTSAARHDDAKGLSKQRKKSCSDIVSGQTFIGSPAASTSEQITRRACSSIRACNGDHLPSSDSSAALTDLTVHFAHSPVDDRWHAFFEVAAASVPHPTPLSSLSSSLLVALSGSLAAVVIAMKKPDGWKHEAWLRRILDADKFDSIVYFEEAVLADSATLQAKGKGETTADGSDPHCTFINC